jgi:hypothetical protein
MSFRSTFKFVLLLWIALAPTVSRAQQTGGTLHGTVADPDNAVIPGATVTLTPTSGKALTTQSQSDGTYTLRGVPTGTYSMTVTMQGFATFVKQGIRVAAGQSLAIDAKMAIQVESQEVQVTAQSAQVSVDQDSNASSTVIKGKDLDALSDDPDELSSARLQGRMADRFMWMDLPVGSFRRSRRFARSASTRIRFRRSSTSWVMAAWRCSQSRVRTRFMDSIS